MILDHLDAAKQYCRLHPGFDAAFDLLASTPFDEISPGRHEVMGESLFMIIDHADGKGRESARLEAHRKYIDVQYNIPGEGAVAEEFGWRPTISCTNVSVKYDKEKEVMFFADPPEMWLPVRPGHFVIFFPTDAHAPLANSGSIRKAVVKIAVEW